MKTTTKQMISSNLIMEIIAAMITFLAVLLLLVTKVNAGTGFNGDGVYMIATKIDTAYILDVAGPSYDNYANLQIWTDANVDNQKFLVQGVGNGEYTIISLFSGKALEASGKYVYQNTPDSSNPAQRWVITGSEYYCGYYFIINSASGLYLDVENAYTDLGVNVQAFVRNGLYDAQDWQFIQIGTINETVGCQQQESYCYQETPCYNETAESSCYTETTQESCWYDESAETPCYNETSEPSCYEKEDECYLIVEELEVTPEEIIQAPEPQIVETPVSYTINYVLNGDGVNNSGNVSTYTGKETVVLRDASRNGYTFSGWYTDSSLTSRITEIPAGSVGNVTVYAKWTKIINNAWTKWSQKTSTNNYMSKYGCRITAFAMMFAEAGYDSQFSSPLEFYNQLLNIGAINSSCTEMGVYGSIATNYAKHLGGKAVVSARKTAAESLSKSSNMSGAEKAIMDILRATDREYYIVMQVNGNSAHTVYVMRNKSLSEGCVWIQDPATGTSFKFSNIGSKYSGRKCTYRTVYFSGLQ